MILQDTGSTFEPAPSGVHVARLYRLIDLGSQAGNYNGKTRHNRKLLFTFELLGDERMDDGQPFSISRRFTATLGEKGALRPFLESWRGKKYTPDELKAGLPLEKMLGAYGLINLVENEREGRIYSNIASISPLPRGMEKPEGHNPLQLFDLSAPDWDVFANLSERLQETILDSAEGRTAYNASGATPSNTTPGNTAAATGAGVEFDDDVPF